MLHLITCHGRIMPRLGELLFTVLDLHSAYFSIPVHDESRKYLKFVWKGNLYEFIFLSCL